ncbi:MAG: hypothetical protein ACI9GE_000781 [Oceanospirillaceae bacterium]|jgi:hypothetical protein
MTIPKRKHSLEFKAKAIFLNPRTAYEYEKVLPQSTGGNIY